MTIDQAYQLLDRVMSSLQLTRQEHVTLQQALGVLVTAAKDGQEKKCASFDVTDLYKEEVDGGANKCPQRE